MHKIEVVLDEQWRAFGYERWRRCWMCEVEAVLDERWRRSRLREVEGVSDKWGGDADTCAHGVRCARQGGRRAYEAMAVLDG